MRKKLLKLCGELLVTAGVLSLLYFAYGVLFTNTISEAATKVTAHRLLKAFDQAAETGAAIPIPEQPPELTDGVQLGNVFVPIDPFALVYIPRLKSDVWEEPLVQGVYHRALASGIGHYPSTQMPGEVGNFAIAGHRATNGEPFAKFERLQKGDSIFIRTQASWVQYRLVKDKIIQPDEVWVLADSPDGQGFEPGASLISLTTCDPRFNSYQRWVWWGELVAIYPQDQTPAEILGEQ